MLSWKNCPIMPINAVQNRKRRFSCFLNAWFSLLSEKEIMHSKTRKLKSLCGFVLIGMICHFFSAISYITVMMYKHKLCVIWTRIDIWNKKKSKNFEIMHSKKRAWIPINIWAGDCSNSDVKTILMSSLLHRAPPKDFC